MGTPEAGVRQMGGAGRFFLVMLVVIIIVGLGGVVTYLLSDINRRQYRLTTEEGMLIIERGRLFPFGFEPYQPNDETLRAAYAPIPLPPGEKLDEHEVFSERSDLDRALFGLLAGWARRGLDAHKAGDLKLATTYVTRCEMLPGLSEEQRAELRTLQADLAYRTGRQLLADIVDNLNKALAQFQLALKLGTSRAADAQRWIAEIQHRIASYATPQQENTGPGGAGTSPETDGPGQSPGSSESDVIPVPPPLPKDRKSSSSHPTKSDHHFIPHGGAPRGQADAPHASTPMNWRL